MPVVFNCSHSTFDGSVELAQAADASGAAAVLMMPPHFYRYTQAHIAGFYRQVAEAAELRIPLLLYNIPQFTTEIVLEPRQTCCARVPFRASRTRVGMRPTSRDSSPFGNRFRLLSCSVMMG